MPATTILHTYRLSGVPLWGTSTSAIILAANETDARHCLTTDSDSAWSRVLSCSQIDDEPYDDALLATSFQSCGAYVISRR